MTRPLPTVARENLRMATMIILAQHPGAAEIDFTPGISTSPFCWQCFSFMHRGKPGVATLNANYENEGVRTEWPYKPIAHLLK